MNKDNSQNGNKEDASVTRKTRYVTVAPSPLNVVKLDLAIIIFLSIIVAIFVMNYFDDTQTQLMTLSGFGLFCMFWLIVRTKRVLSRLQSGALSKQHDEKT